MSVFKECPKCHQMIAEGTSHGAPWNPCDPSIHEREKVMFQNLAGTGSEFLPPVKITPAPDLAAELETLDKFESDSAKSKIVVGGAPIAADRPTPRKQALEIEWQNGKIVDTDLFSEIGRLERELAQREEVCMFNADALKMAEQERDTLRDELTEAIAYGQGWERRAADAEMALELTNAKIDQLQSAQTPDSAGLEAAVEKAQDDSDDLWLSEIAKQYKEATGECWDDMDGETREEGIAANIRIIFSLLAKAQGEREELSQLVSKMVPYMSHMPACWDAPSPNRTSCQSGKSQLVVKALSTSAEGER